LIAKEIPKKGIKELVQEQEEKMFVPYYLLIPTLDNIS
jgi:hypothetical protein